MQYYDLMRFRLKEGYRIEVPVIEVVKGYCPLSVYSGFNSKTDDL